MRPEGINSDMYNKIDFPGEFYNRSLQLTRIGLACSCLSSKRGESERDISLFSNQPLDKLVNPEDMLKRIRTLISYHVTGNTAE